MPYSLRNRDLAQDDRMALHSSSRRRRRIKKEEGKVGQ
jgi:hypothetical protein